MKINFIQSVQDTLQQVQEFLPDVARGAAATGAGVYYRTEIAHKSFDLAISVITMVVLSVGSFLIKEYLNHLKAKRIERIRLKKIEEMRQRQEKLNVIV